MPTISHRELRNKSAEILRRVAAGETFEITNHGVAAAVLIPPPATQLELLRAAGKTRPPTNPDFDLASIKRTKAAVSSEEILRDVRGEW